MVKKIYLIRHGQTDFNLAGRMQGSGINRPLDETGLAQAQAFYQYYHNFGFKHVYTSELLRAQQTVQGFKNDGFPYSELRELNEISFGNLEGSYLNDQASTVYFDIMRNWSKGNLEFKAPGGESPIDVTNRQRPFIDMLLATPELSPILVCMHGRAMRILLCGLLDVPLSKMDQFVHSNTGLYIIHLENGKFTLEVENDTQHLLVNQVPVMEFRA